MQSVAYGARPLPLPSGLVAEVCLPPPPAPETDLQDLLTNALESPVACPPLAAMVEAHDEITIVITHGMLDEPRGAMVRALLRELAAVPPNKIRFAVANEGRAPGPVASLGLGELAKRHIVLNHDANALGEMVELGVTGRGVRVRVPKTLAHASVVVSTGRIRPHVLSGFSGGADAIFPGLGASEDIAALGELARGDAGGATARLGRIAGNAYREELEAAAKLLPGRLFLLNVLFSHDRPLGAVAGHVVSAHRKGCEAARKAFELAAEMAKVVIVSDALPVTATLADAMRLLAPAGALLQPGGAVILAAECPRGTGPVDEVTRAAFERNMGRYFRGDGVTKTEIFLVSSLPPAVVGQTFCRYASTLEEAVKRATAAVGSGRVLVLPRAADVVPAGSSG